MRRHRKWIVVGVIAAVVIGVGVWYSSYLSRRESSVQYHKAEYLAARDGRPLMNEVRSLWGEITGRKVRHRIPPDKLQRHEQALLRLGYWREQTVTVSNVTAPAAWNIVVKKGATVWRYPLTREICVVSPRGTNSILVRAVPDHLPIWERLIREADVLQIQE